MTMWSLSLQRLTRCSNFLFHGKVWQTFSDMSPLQTAITSPVLILILFCHSWLNGCMQSATWTMMSNTWRVIKPNESGKWDQPTVVSFKVLWGSTTDHSCHVFLIKRCKTQAVVEQPLCVMISEDYNWKAQTTWDRCQMLTKAIIAFSGASKINSSSSRTSFGRVIYIPRETTESID